MIAITGALGFIGTSLVDKFNQEGYKKNILVVDDFYKKYKSRNLDDKFIREWVHRDIFLRWFERMHSRVDFVYHLGARTDTVSKDKELFDELNLEYSKTIWDICTRKSIPMIYASSAATYGDGKFGYDDDHGIVSKLKPLNVYGESKNDFDKWVLKQKETPPYWVGFKFFNVYGPNESYKRRMASVAFHAYHQIKETGSLKLFRSHKKGIKNGEQKRDFIYVKDVVDVLFYLLNHIIPNGLYNLGSGKANTFLDLAKHIFAAMDQPVDIQFIDTPKDIRSNYQYFTEANMTKLRTTGYDAPFHSLKDGVTDYVQNYLMKNK